MALQAHYTRIASSSEDETTTSAMTVESRQAARPEDFIYMTNAEFAAYIERELHEIFKNDEMRATKKKRLAAASSYKRKTPAMMNKPPRVDAPTKLTNPPAQGAIEGTILAISKTEGNVEILPCGMTVQSKGKAFARSTHLTTNNTVKFHTVTKRQPAPGESTGFMSLCQSRASVSPLNVTGRQPAPNESKGLTFVPQSAASVSPPTVTERQPAPDEFKGLTFVPQSRASVSPPTVTERQPVPEEESKWLTSVPQSAANVSPPTVHDRQPAPDESKGLTFAPQSAASVSSPTVTECQLAPDESKGFTSEPQSRASVSPPTITLPLSSTNESPPTIILPACSIIVPQPATVMPQSPPHQMIIVRESPTTQKVNSGPQKNFTVTARPTSPTTSAALSRSSEPVVRLADAELQTLKAMISQSKLSKSRTSRLINSGPQTVSTVTVRSGNPTTSAVLSDSSEPGVSLNDAERKVVKAVITRKKVIKPAVVTLMKCQSGTSEVTHANSLPDRSRPSVVGTLTQSPSPSLPIPGNSSLDRSRPSVVGTLTQSPSPSHPIPGNFPPNRSNDSSSTFNRPSDRHSISLPLPTPCSSALSVELAPRGRTAKRRVGVMSETTLKSVANAGSGEETNRIQKRKCSSDARANRANFDLLSKRRSEAELEVDNILLPMGPEQLVTSSSKQSQVLDLQTSAVSVTVSSTPPPVLNHSSSSVKKQVVKKKKGPNHSKLVRDILQAWLVEHRANPFPTAEEKRQLMEQTELDFRQVGDWFANARGRPFLQNILENERKDPEHFRHHILPLYNLLPARTSVCKPQNPGES